MNTFDTFVSLSGGPVYNPILISAVNMILQQDVDLHVVYILGPLNHVADTLLCYQNNMVDILVPGIHIEPFMPPQDAMGAVKK